MDAVKKNRDAETTENISPPFNKEGLLSAFMDDWDFLKEVVGMFVSDYPAMITTIGEALDNKDAKTLHRAAHSLKGVLLNFQADASAKMAMKLEEMGRQGELEGADEVYQALVSEIASLEKILLDLIKEVTR